ncbi:MAG: DUF4340 domain-containing protein [Calditrichaeota bacterium]|nr:DUF4340 domain-containing protein [Calditrichota bacterium]
MKFKQTLFLLVAFIFLAGYVYIVEVKQHKKKEEEKKRAEQVFHFEKDSVKILQVRNQYGTFRFEKRGESWQILEPVETEADKTPITTVLNNLKNAKMQTQFTIRPDEKKEFGFTRKAVRVQLELTDGSRDSLIFGDKTPVGANVFATRGDTVVFTVPQYIKTSLEKRLFDWRDKKVLHFKRADVQRVVIKSPKGRFEFVREKDNQWMIKNINRPADSGQLNTVFSKLEYGRAKAFVDEEGTRLKQYGLKPHRYEVTLFLSAEKGSRTLLISRKIDGKYYAQDISRKPIFEVDSTLVREIRKDLKDFRSRDFAEFDRDKVSRIELDYDDVHLVMVKDTSDQWWLDAEGETRVKNSEVSSFLTSLNFTRIADFVVDGTFSEARYGLDRPYMTIRLFKGEELMLEAKIGKARGDQYYATTSAYPSVYLIKKEDVEDWELKKEDLLESPPQPADTTEAETIS